MLIVAMFCISVLNNRNKETNTPEEDVHEVAQEEVYEVIQGDYDRYIDDLGIRPCPDSLKFRESLYKSEIKKLPVRLVYLHESDTIRVISDVSLEECYLIFEAEKKDTLGFNYEGFANWYYAKAVNINTDYATLEKIKLVVYEQSIGRLSVCLGKKEFEKEFKRLIPYIKLKKRNY